MNDEPEYHHHVINLNFDPAEKDLEQAIIDIAAAAVNAVRDDTVVVVLSDRNLQADKLPVHALLATGAVHHALIENGLRCDSNIVVETGTARDPHHMAVLVGYGATCVYPYLSYEIIQGMVRRNELNSNDLPKLEQNCLLYTSPSPRDRTRSRMPSSA